MKKLFLIFISCLLMLQLTGCAEIMSSAPSEKLKVMASIDYKDMNLESLDDNVSIDYMSDIDAIQEINNNPGDYDALLVSNSMWTYMLNGVYLTESKSLAISPVVFGIKMDTAEKLGIIDSKLETKDIVSLVENKDIKLAMPSAVRTNAGATAYLGMVDAFLGNPEVIRSEDFESEVLKIGMSSLFKNIERPSGSEEFLFELLDDGCNAIVATESAIIRYNKEHRDAPLYIVYPEDGVGITDSMITFIGKADKKEEFLKFRDLLAGESGQKIFKDFSYRTWYGGVQKVSEGDFEREWGTDTTKVLKISNFPSKEVMTKALKMYIDMFRKPAAVMFVLDYSGSMRSGAGYDQLDSAIDMLFHEDKASSEFLQFSPSDQVGVVYFNNGSVYSMNFVKGSDVSRVYDDALSSVSPNGGTPLYESTSIAFSQFENFTPEPGKALDDYSLSLIVMTDGETTGESIKAFEQEYKENFADLNIPVYAIAFGEADTKELAKLAEMTNGKFFDGRENLVQAFKEIRGYN